MIDRAVPSGLAFTASGTGEIAWDNLTICQTCFGLHGEWTLRDSPERVQFYQRCRCKSAVPEARKVLPPHRRGLPALEGKRVQRGVLSTTFVRRR